MTVDGINKKATDQIREIIAQRKDELQQVIKDFNVHPITLQFQINSALLNGQIMALNDLIEDEEPIVEQDESKQVEKSINGVSR